MLLCILEEDVGYRPSIKTGKQSVGQGQDLRLLICWVRRAEWPRTHSGGSVGEASKVGRAKEPHQLHCDAVYI